MSGEWIVNTSGLRPRMPAPPTPKSSPGSG
jgi:hypothetical protein